MKTNRASGGSALPATFLAGALGTLLLSCGGGASDLLARQAASHEALQAAGLQPIGSVDSGTVAAGREARIERRFEQPGCFVVQALLGGSAEGATLRVVDERGEELGAGRGQRSATVRFCVAEPQQLALVLGALHGEGEFLLGAYAGDVGSGSGAGRGAVAEASCRRPTPLRPGEEVEGDTSTGRSLLRGSCGPPGAPEHVYALRVERPSVLTAVVQSQYDAVLYVQRSCGDPRSEVGCNDDARQGDTTRSELRVALEPGDYFVVVDGYPGNNEAPPAGPYTLLTTLEPLPEPGQLCSEAEVLVPGQRAQGDTSQRVDRFQASCAGGARSGERVYRIDLDAPARLRLRTEANFDVATYLRAECTDAATELACNDDYVQPNRSLITARVPAGRRYLFVDGFSEQGRTNQGRFTVLMERAPADGDGQGGADTCDAAAVVGTDPLELDSFRARDDTKGSCGGAGAADVVATLEVQRRSRVRIEFTDAEFHGVVYVRRQCDEPGSEVFCEPFRPPERNRGGFKRTVVERVLEPGTYAIFFDGQSEHAFGRVKVKITTVDLAALSRDCRRAPLLREGRWTEGSTADGEDRFHASCGEGTASPDRVFRLRLRRRRRVTVRVEGQYDTVLHLRRDCTDRGSEVACNDDFRGNERASEISATLDRGTYYVIVDGFRDRGKGSFKVRYETSAP